MKPFKWPLPKREPQEQQPALDLKLEEENLTGIVKGYSATDIEERMYIAFLHNGVSDDNIEYQPSFIAGRNMSGEIRPDFAVYNGLIQIWYADEEFFHKTAEQQQKDAFNDARLMEEMQDKIEPPIRIPGDDLDTQDRADEAISEWVR